MLTGRGVRRVSGFLHVVSVRRLAAVFALATLGSVLQLAHPALGSVDSALQDDVLAMRSPESYLGGLANTGRDPRSFITIVAIDERTLAELGAYNGGYPRAYHAQVIENLLAAPPRVIALDLGFFEPTADDAALAAALDRAHSLPVPTTVILSAAGLQATDGAAPGAPAGELAFEPWARART